jgi:prepilin-type N-terminal cleavage/methylation domain-containing protein
MKNSTQRQLEMQLRSGFTLIELMVVTGIIAVLVGLVIVALPAFITNSRQAATETVIKKVDAMLQDRMSAMELYFEESNRRATAKDGTTRIKPPSYVDRTSNPNIRAKYRALIGDTANANILDDWEIVSKKFLKQKHFPMTFLEADGDYDESDDSSLVTFDDGSRVVPSNLSSLGHTAETESAEVLYWFLTNGTQFGAEPVGTGDFAPNEIADTDGDGLLEIVDAWGEPLRFYRWPTRMVRPQLSGDETDPINPNTIPINTSIAAEFLVGNLPPIEILRHDPEDPLDDLRRNQLGGTAAAPTQLTEQQLEPLFHTMRTWHAPLILSAGEDRSLGLLEPNDSSNYGHLGQPDYSNLEGLYDNVSNLLLRTGGK